MKPTWVFDRSHEWDVLTRFISAERQGSRLGLLYGRRRQGKTLLLQALREATDGFYWQAVQQSARQNLGSFGQAWAQFLGAAAPYRFMNWRDALAAVTSHTAVQPTAVLLDEIGYLIDAAPEIPSVLQEVLSPAGRARTVGNTRIVLCGSAFGQMARLAGSNAPLRGRVDLVLVVRPFRYRDAATFWGLASNPDAAFRLHALVGGTPAYKDMAGGVPEGGDIDLWAVNNLLEHSAPLFREGRLVIAEDAALTDQQLFWGLLGALADGAGRRGDLARVLGREPSALAHGLATLTDAGWVSRIEDPLRAKRSTYVVTEPIVRAHRLLVEPQEARLAVAGHAAAVWDERLPRVRAEIYGPHLETLVSEFLQLDCSEELLGGRASVVGPTTVKVGNNEQQIDVAVVETTPTGGRRLLALGEVKATTTAVGLGELKRLDNATGEHYRCARSKMSWATFWTAVRSDLSASRNRRTPHVVQVRHACGVRWRHHLPVA